MTTTLGLTTRAAAAGGCCIVAALSYSGAVTTVALLAFVVPAVVLVTTVTAGAARLSLRLAAGSGVLTALAVAEVVNLVSGSAHGPAARSTFVAAAFTALAVTAALGPAPALFAAAVVGVVVGALGLGAGAEVAPVAVATAVAMVAGLAVIEAERRHWTRRPPQLVTVATLALLVGAFAAAVALQADRHIHDAPAVLAPGAVQPTISPPRVLGDRSPEPAPPVTETSESVDTSAPPNESTTPLRAIWLAVLILLAALLVGVLLRILLVALAWRLLRRRLRRGSESDQVAGAWLWCTRRLRAAGWPMPPSLSADAVRSGRGIAELPRDVRRSLRQVAASTVDAVYAPPSGGPDSGHAWSAAEDVSRSATKALPLARRASFLLGPLPSVRPTPRRPAPATSEEYRS